jgi:hypothetical protein
MKRTGSWGRKSPLRSKTSFVGSTPADRSARLTRKAITAKRKPVAPEETAAKAVVRARSGGVCEICGVARAENFSHRLAKGHGGPWLASNGLDACGWGNYSGCHGERVHQQPTEAEQAGWLVRSGHDFRTIPVQHAWLGLVLLHDNGSTTPFEEKRAA